MNIHECVLCADNVDKHGDVQVKRVGHLASIDNHTESVEDSNGEESLS